VVGLAALILDVPLAGTIGVVTFVTAYVPYIGAVIAGVFAVLLALGAHGTGVAVAMLIVVILANGLLQNIMQPFAMGSALHLNPLVVLVVTIGAGCLFGMLGLVLAAPLVSAAVRVAKALSNPAEAAETHEEPAPGDTLIPTG
jgi:predicted PurR-regulated permease PerM